MQEDCMCFLCCAYLCSTLTPSFESSHFQSVKTLVWDLGTRQHYLCCAYILYLIALLPQAFSQLTITCSTAGEPSHCCKQQEAGWDLGASEAAWLYSVYFSILRVYRSLRECRAMEMTVWMREHNLSLTKGLLFVCWWCHWQVGVTNSLASFPGYSQSISRATRSI